MIEVWEVDSHGRNKLAGYGVISIPFRQGLHEIDMVCWRPKPNLGEKLIGAYPELEYRDLLLASQNRHGFKTESTGKIRVEVSVVLKDFDLHGITV